MKNEIKTIKNFKSGNAQKSINKKWRERFVVITGVANSDLLHTVIYTTKQII